MNVDFLFLLAQQQQAGGGGFTWTMTAGTDGTTTGYNDPPGGYGSISNEPISTGALSFQASQASMNVFRALSFVGDVRTELAGITELVIDGNVFRLQSINFSAGLTVWNTYPDGFPVYVNGTTYNCELR